MVLMHKLKQSEQVDLAHFHKSKDEAVDNILYQTQTLQRPVSPPHRPQTRSQSGRPAKRRVILDNALDEATNSTTPNKKPRLSPQKRNVAVKPKESTPPNSPPPKDVKFIQADPSIQNEPSNRPGPRTRITIPVPVPNLTKKSRGRRVPTTATVTNTEKASEGQARKYVCQVAECGKCFHRGEHLKRHIRSIHTNEKPFKCPAVDCNKTFNRHDNLLQHVKIHAPSKADESGRVPTKRKPYATSSSSSLGSMSTRVTISDPEEEDDEDEDTDAEGEVDEETKTLVIVPYGMVPTGETEQSPVRGAAVSSLRTEMPDVDGGAGEVPQVPAAVEQQATQDVIYQLMDMIDGYDTLK